MMSKSEIYPRRYKISGIMRRKLLRISLIFITCAGCALSHYQIVPQEKPGPNGGSLVFIDQRIPEYIEFVTNPLNNGKGDWKFQMYSYDKNLRPKSISRNCYVEVELSDGTKKSANLWSTKRFFWNKEIDHLANTIKLGDVKQFDVLVTLKSHSMQDNLKFKYPS